MSGQAEQRIAEKYQSAFDEMDRQRVQVAERRMLPDNKLYVLAFGPTEEAKNKVWDQIKLVDPNYSDLTCDIRIGAPQQVHSAFDRMSEAAPGAALASALAAAFKSDRTAPFGQMIGQLFGQSNPEQRAGLLNQLSAVTPSGLAAEVLGLAGGQRQVTAEQAQQVSPEAVQKLAASAQEHDASIIDRVSDFYAKHPNIVKTLGIGALVEIVSHITKGMRGRPGGGA
jgi:hypothetical protein